MSLSSDRERLVLVRHRTDGAAKLGERTRRSSAAEKQGRASDRSRTHGPFTRAVVQSDDDSDGRSDQQI